MHICWSRLAPCLPALLIFATLTVPGHTFAGSKDSHSWHKNKHLKQYDSHKAYSQKEHKGNYFNRIAAFPVCKNTDCFDNDIVTVAEIVAADEDGKTLIYTDGPGEQIGFVDIRNPNSPQASGVVPVGGEPTSVAVKGRYALVGVNTSSDFVNPSGKLSVIDIKQRTIVTEIDLAGQPDSVSVSPSGRYAAIAIENERDEDLGDGEPPQAPGGFLVIVDIKGNPGKWNQA